MADLNVKGLDELHRQLQAISAELQNNAMRGAMRAGARVIERAAKGAVAVHDGDLRKSIRTSTRKRGGSVTATVKAGSKAAFYAHMVEFGTAAHLIKPKSRKACFCRPGAPGHQPPWRQGQALHAPAFDAQAQAAVEAMRDHLARRLEQIAAARAGTPPHEPRDPDPHRTAGRRHRHRPGRHPHRCGPPAPGQHIPRHRAAGGGRRAPARPGPVGSVVVAVDARIQVNPVATTLASVKAIHAAVDAALSALNNTTVGGKRIVHCVWALLGPADHDIETGLWTQPVDFSLRWLH